MSAGPMQFPRSGRWLLRLIVLVFAGPFLVALPASTWLNWTMNPVQTFYLGTYLAASVGVGLPGEATTAVRWAEKTAPGHKPQPLLAEDAVKGPDPKHPLSLSPKALAAGWSGVEIIPQTFRTAELKTYLQNEVYDGDSAWAIFLKPICYELAGFVFGLGAMTTDYLASP